MLSSLLGYDCRVTKAIVLSDLHGDDESLRAVMAMDADLILFAGDLGLRNPSVSMVLRNRSVPFISVRGNCDSPWDYEPAGLPMAPLHLSMTLNGHDVFMSHGDRGIRPDCVSEGMIVITGHTHVPSLERENGVIYLNPGSASRPRGRFGPSFAVIDESCIEIKELGTGAVISRMELD